MLTNKLELQVSASQREERGGSLWKVGGPGWGGVVVLADKQPISVQKTLSITACTCKGFLVQLNIYIILFHKNKMYIDPDKSPMRYLG